MILNKNYKTYLLILPVVFFMILPVQSMAQKKAKKEKTQIITLEGVISDESGNPLKDVMVLANEGSEYTISSSEGTYSILSNEGGVILFEAFGFEDFVLDLKQNPAIRNITMGTVPLFTGKSAEVKLPQLMTTDKRSVVGAVSTIQGHSLETYPDDLLGNMLQGKGLGLTIINNAGGMANNPPSMYLRGLASNSNNRLITVVDGIERPIHDLLPQEIETIELLKDPTAKILMGSRAARGVLMITTKKGEKFKRDIRTSVSYGVGLPTRMPQYLNSYDYAVLFNEARENDGMAPLYSQADIDGYKNSSGPNDLRYPNVDYYDYFLNDYTSMQKASTEFIGGNERLQYAFVLGYSGYTGLQKYGETPRNDRFNARGNMNISISNAISANVGIASVIEYWKRGGLDHSETFSRLSTHRPNEYPLELDHPNLPESEGDDEDKVYYGASYDRSDNLLSSLLYGESSNEYLSNQMNFGLNFDLKSLTEGLSANAFITFDNFFGGERRLDRNAPAYAQRWVITPEGADSVIFDEVLRETINNDYELINPRTIRNQGLNAKVNYKKTLGSHYINSDLGFFYSKIDIPGSGDSIPQDIINTNSFLRVNYNFKHKYYAEASVALMGSNRFEPGNKHFLSTALGAAWIISEEGFMQNVEIFDFLKLKASWGILGYDASTSHMLYNREWRNSGSVSFGEQNKDSKSRVVLSNYQSPGLEWEKSREFNIGIEGLALNQRLQFEINYFNEYNSNIIIQQNSIYSSIYSGFFPYTNYGEVANMGVEAELHWTGKVGDFGYTIGGNMIWSENKQVVIDEIAYPDNRKTQGLPTDAIIAYKSLGLFGKDVPLEGHANQTFGSYQLGDIAYDDIYEDGEINDLDRTMVGNNFPRMSYGIDLNLSYKGFGLYVLATGLSKVYTVQRNNYYSNTGIDKYSELAFDRYHEVNNPDGIYPRLSTTDANNNYVSSDFWMHNTSFFRLKNVELSYTINRIPANIAKNLKIFIRGTNLLVISEVKELDPEAMNAGVNNYPIFSTYTGGLTVTF